ncbi:MFS transporter [Patescibacteria group bacterium]|nr:MFS transporter [Patescibacteria group bacterium]MBU1074478.1 MFS transporter [Patescibacteria group bacterium]MBU1951948.1 MFS transporter [Patescibacteria group bacterium]
MFSRSIIRSIGHYKINVIIKVLIISDFLIWSSYQLFAPIFAIFVTDKIENGSIEIVGIASAIYLITKSLCEIPVGMKIDKSKSEKDDLYTAVFGTILTAIAYLTYIGINSIQELYLVQALLGVGSAFAFPGWYSIFTRHVDRGKEAYEWSLYDVLLGIGMAFAAALGGFLANSYGFNTLFIIIGVSTFFGAMLLLAIKKKIYNK